MHPLHFSTIITKIVLSYLTNRIFLTSYFQHISAESTGLTLECPSVKSSTINIYFHDFPRSRDHRVQIFLFADDTARLTISHSLKFSLLYYAAILFKRPTTLSIITTKANPIILPNACCDKQSHSIQYRIKVYGSLPTHSSDVPNPLNLACFLLECAIKRAHQHSMKNQNIQTRENLYTPHPCIILEIRTRNRLRCRY